MCGRFALRRQRLDPGEFHVPRFPDLTGIVPRYNVAPGSLVLAVRDVPARKGEAPPGEREAVLLKWGLVPSWAKEPSIGNKLANARAEGIDEKPSFRSAFKQRRCVVLADAFYEWQKVPGQKTKQPFALEPVDGQPFAFAGVWEWWRPRGTTGEEGPGLETVALITTTPNADMAPIHDRMPVTIPRAELGTWLDPETPLADVREMLRPAPDHTFRAWPVSTYLNRPGNEGETCVAPLAAD